MEIQTELTDFTIVINILISDLIKFEERCLAENGYYSGIISYLGKKHPELKKIFKEECESDMIHYI